MSNPARSQRGLCQEPGCPEPSVAICDHEVKTARGAWATCDRRVCACHRQHYGSDDYCPTHARRAQPQLDFAGWLQGRR